MIQQYENKPGVIMTNKTFLTIFLALSFCMFFVIGQAVAAFGDCLSWIWGGNNESTTYSPPYSPTVASMTDPNGSQTVLGQSDAASPVYVAPPTYADACPPEYFPSSSYSTHSAMKPTPPTTELLPVVKKEWTYAPITSVTLKPVQQTDPKTGQVSTVYRTEESKTLLPWLHRKETIEYKPVLTPSKLLQIPAPAAPSPRVIQANYAAPQSQIVQTTQASNFYDPCGNLVRIDAMRGLQGLHVSEPIPIQATGDLILSQSPNASSTVSTFVSRNTGARDVNYGIPPVREGYEPNRTVAYSERTPGSVADQIPVVDRFVRRLDMAPQTQPLISEADFRPVHPFNPEKTVEVEKPEFTDTTVKSSNMITTPVPDLPMLKPKKEAVKLVSPTQVHKKYQPPVIRQ